jgi:hypothetical protein
MYDICQSAVKISNRHSEYFNVEIGVKQMDSWSPTLFNYYILMIHMTFVMDHVTPYNLRVLIYLVLVLLMI